MSTVPNAFGNALAPPITRVGAGVQTEWAVVLPPNSKVAAYVNSNGMADQDDEFLRGRIVTTLNEALSRARSGKGDYVVVMNDHAENISTADQMSNLVAGTKIIGMGSGNRRPTFTWTAAAATFLFDVANVTLSNCILKMADTGNAGVTCVAPITVSAAGCEISNCRIIFGADADDIVTIGITTTAAADDFTFSGNKCTGATAAECTTFMQLVGADRFTMHDCYIEGATSDADVGVMRLLTTASTQIDVQRCVFVNRKASSVQAVTGHATSTGIVKDCGFGILDDASLRGWNVEGDCMFFNCQVVNLDGEAGAAKLVLSTGT